MPVLHAMPSVLVADVADLHARCMSALFVACGCFPTWIVHGQQCCWLACWLPVRLSIYAALPAQRGFMALHHSFAGMPVEAFKTSLHAVGQAAAPASLDSAVLICDNATLVCDNAILSCDNAILSPC